MMKMSKPHAHLQTMNKIYKKKFQNGQDKIVGRVALTKYPLIASEMLKFTSWKKKLDNYNY